VRARKRFGQHFLEAPWVARVLDAASPDPADVFLEIGPGQGALTIPLAARVARVVAVEVDRDLAARLARHAPPNVHVVTADVLKADLTRLLADGPPALRRRVVGNLPYNVSTPIIFRLLETARGLHPPHDATLMVQREVADRLVAGPGGGDYGVLSVLTQVRADVTRAFDLPPGAFRPVPKVRSSLVRLVFRPERVLAAHSATFNRLVRTVFSQRRKVLANALKPFADAAGVSVAAALEEADLDGRRRPETLQLMELTRLAAVFATAAWPPVL